MPVSVSEYLTPSWSLSPSSSPLSHSEPSDSDRDSDDASAQSRMPTPQRRKKRKASPATHAKRNPVQQPPSHPPSFPLSLSPSSLQSTAPSRPVFKCPAPAGVPANSVSVSVGRGQSSVAEKQRCVYCRRHFRSLQRHMDKHHAHQPDMQSALEQAQNTFLPNSPPLSSSSSIHFQCPQHVEVGKPQSPPISLSPVRKSPGLSSPTRKSLAPPPTTPPRRGGVPVSVLKRSPPTPATPPRKGGRKIKKEKEDVKVSAKTKATEVPTLALVEQVKEVKSKPLKEEREENEEIDDESGAEDKNDLLRSVIYNQTQTFSLNYHCLLNVTFLILLFLFSQFASPPHAPASLFPLFFGVVPATTTALRLHLAHPLAAVSRGLATPVSLQPGSPHPLQPPARMRSLQTNHFRVPSPHHTPVSQSRATRDAAGPHPTRGLPLTLRADGPPPSSPCRGPGEAGPGAATHPPAAL